MRFKRNNIHGENGALESFGPEPGFGVINYHGLQDIFYMRAVFRALESIVLCLQIGHFNFIVIRFKFTIIQADNYFFPGFFKILMGPELSYSYPCLNFFR